VNILHCQAGWEEGLNRSNLRKRRREEEGSRGQSHRWTVNRQKRQYKEKKKKLGKKKTRPWEEKPFPGEKKPCVLKAENDNVSTYCSKEEKKKNSNGVTNHQLDLRFCKAPTALPVAKTPSKIEKKKEDIIPGPSL
jgi:hypothetical protein